MDNKETFPPDLLKRMIRLYYVLHEVLPLSNLGEWIRGFVGEMRPENEVRIHEAITKVYLDVLDGPDASLQEKKRLYVVVVMVSSGMAMRDMDKGLPDGAPGSDELFGRWKQAFTANEPFIPPPPWELFPDLQNLSVDPAEEALAIIKWGSKNRKH